MDSDRVRTAGHAIERGDEARSQPALLNSWKFAEPSLCKVRHQEIIDHCFPFLLPRWTIGLQPLPIQPRIFGFQLGVPQIAAEAGEVGRLAARLASPNRWNRRRRRRRDLPNSAENRWTCVSQLVFTPPADNERSGAIASLNGTNIG